MHYEVKREVSVSAVIAVPFECPSCGHRAKATVSLHRTGTTTQRVEARDAYALPVLREAGPATGVPSVGMEIEAKDLVALAPCPSCGRRNASATRSSMLRAWGCALLLAAVSLAIGVALGMAALSSTVGVAFGVIGGLIGLVAVVVVIGSTRKQHADAATQVRFEPL